MSSLSNPLNLCCPTTIPATFESTTQVSAAANMPISSGSSSTLVWMSLLKLYCRLPVLLLRRSQLGFLVACIKIGTLSKLTPWVMSYMLRLTPTCSSKQPYWLTGYTIIESVREDIFLDFDFFNYVSWRHFISTFGSTTLVSAAANMLIVTSPSNLIICPVCCTVILHFIVILSLPFLVIQDFQFHRVEPLLAYPFYCQGRWSQKC